MHWFEWLAFGFFMVGGAAIVTYSTLYLSRRGWSPIEILLPIRPMQRILCLIRRRTAGEQCPDESLVNPVER